MHRKPALHAKPKERHPKKTIYDYPLLNSGFEGVIYKKGNGTVLKLWRQDWILAHYKMLASGKKAFGNAAKRAQRRFHSEHDILTVEDKSIPHHGIPMEKFRMITFIMSKASEDILSRARAEGIPVPQVARTVRHP